MICLKAVLTFLILSQTTYLIAQEQSKYHVELYKTAGSETLDSKELKSEKSIQVAFELLKTKEILIRFSRPKQGRKTSEGFKSLGGKYFLINSDKTKAVEIKSTGESQSEPSGILTSYKLSLTEEPNQKSFLSFQRVESDPGYFDLSNENRFTKESGARILTEDDISTILQNIREGKLELLLPNPALRSLATPVKIKDNYLILDTPQNTTLVDRPFIWYGPKGQMKRYAASFVYPKIPEEQILKMANQLFSDYPIEVEGEFKFTSDAGDLVIDNTIDRSYWVEKDGKKIEINEDLTLDLTFEEKIDLIGKIDAANYFEAEYPKLDTNRFFD